MDRHGGTTHYCSKKKPAQMGNIEEQINIQEPIVQVLFNSGGAIFDATTAATNKQV